MTLYVFCIREPERCLILRIDKDRDFWDDFESDDFFPSGPYVPRWKVSPSFWQRPLIALRHTVQLVLLADDAAGDAIVYNFAPSMIWLMAQ